MKVDTFNTKTFDDVTVQLEAVIGRSTAKIIVPGSVKYRVSVEISKNAAFDLYHEASVLTYVEFRRKMDIEEAAFKRDIALPATVDNSSRIEDWLG